MKTKTHTISFFKSFFYVAFLSVTTGLYGQISKSKTEKIDALINSYTSIKQFNGNVLVVQKGKSVFFKNYGLSDMELQVPNKRETKFRIGSITKEFTAVLTMQLIEQGKINLDSSLVKYLPWYNRETGSKIKIKHLLSHTSGLDNYTVNPEFYNMMAYFSGQPKEFAEKYCQYGKLLFEFGQQKSDTFLNDFGYTLLQKGKTKESLTILKLAAEENPKSANVLDSYAEALRADNQYTASIDYYKRALSLEPNNKRFREEILKLEEQMKK